MSSRSTGFWKFVSLVDITFWHVIYDKHKTAKEGDILYFMWKVSKSAKFAQAVLAWVSRFHSHLWWHQQAFKMAVMHRNSHSKQGNCYFLWPASKGNRISDLSLWYCQHQRLSCCHQSWRWGLRLVRHEFRIAVNIKRGFQMCCLLDILPELYCHLFCLPVMKAWRQSIVSPLGT